MKLQIDTYMTQEERWMANWTAVMDFITANHRNPSKHRIEEHLMLNWVKHNRKLLKAGKMAPERVEMMGVFGRFVVGEET